MLPTITIDGRLTDDPGLRFTTSGVAVCSFRVAASDSKKLDSGEWENTEQISVGVSLWEGDAETAAETLRKGDRVVVTGRVYEREYQKRDGTWARTLETKYATVARVIDGKRSGTPAPERPAAPAQDPWKGQANQEAAPF